MNFITKEMWQMARTSLKVNLELNTQKTFSGGNT